MAKFSFRLSFLSLMICCTFFGNSMTAYGLGSKLRLRITRTMKPSDRETMFSPETQALQYLTPNKTANRRPFSPVGISHNGGQTMDNGIKVYIIWYGNWPSSSKSIIRDFVNALGPQNADVSNSVRRWWKVTGLYFNTNGKLLSQNIVIKGEINDNYSQGKSGLSSTKVETIFTSKLTSKKLPYDFNGIYLILTSDDVSVSGFCTRYCGYHTATWLSSPTQDAYFKYSFIGNPGKMCPSACNADPEFSPNSNPGVDSMISTIAHEITETTTDPEIDAWFDSSTGDENADKCAYDYGAIFANTKGKKYNLVGGKRQFLVQRNWNPKKGACTAGP